MLNRCMSIQNLLVMCICSCCTIARHCYFKNMKVFELSAVLLLVMLNSRFTECVGTIIFTSEDLLTFQAEVYDSHATSYNIRSGWKIVMTFSDPINNIRNVSFRIETGEQFHGQLNISVA